MITVKSSLLVTEIWGLTATEFQTGMNTLISAGTIYNMNTNFDASNFYLRGEGIYTTTTNVLPVPTVIGNYKVSNPSGTYKQVFPSWDSPAMTNGWIAVGTIISAIGLLSNEDEKWLILDKNGGFVNLSRVTPA